MFLTTHAAAGVAISQYVNDPVAVFALSFASHFVLDFIPHGDERLYHDDEWKIQRRFKRVALINTVDISALVGLAMWAATRSQATGGNLLTVGILGAILPDFLSYFFPIIHERFSWLWLVRWLYAATKPTGIRYLVRGQNRIHNLLHHEIVRRDVPFVLGLIIQALLIVMLIKISV